MAGQHYWDGLVSSCAGGGASVTLQPGGALPCTPRVLAGRGGGVVLCGLQCGITLLICIFSKQTPYPGAAALHALSNAPSMREF